MKKNIILSVVVVALAVIGYTNGVTAAGYVKDAARVLKSLQGHEILHPGVMEKSYYKFASTTEAVVCTGKCMVFDVILTSGADGAYAVLRDTATADGSGTTIVSKLEFDGSGHGSLSGNNPNAFPFVTTTGLSIDLSSVSGSEEALVLYKDLD